MSQLSLQTSEISPRKLAEYQMVTINPYAVITHESARVKALSLKLGKQHLKPKYLQAVRLKRKNFSNILKGIYPRFFDFLTRAMDVRYSADREKKTTARVKVD